MAVEFVATIIAASGHKLSSTLLDKLAARSERAGVKDVRVAWLAADMAADVLGLAGDLPAWRAALKEALGGASVDVIVQPAAGRRKKLLIADMESTTIEQELLDELADMIGAREKVAAITRRAMNGEIDFAAALKERVALFAGRPVSFLDEAARRITFMPGAAALAATMKAHGAAAWLVTGGFGVFAKPVAARLGFDRCFANEILIAGGKLTGAVAEPILDRQDKKALLERACKELDVSLAEAVAVGDGANDLPMLLACGEGGGLGIAYHAKPAVRDAVADAVTHGDLTALLYAQGYRRDRFIDY